MLQIVAGLDIILSLLVTPVGTYFLYNETWWIDLGTFGYISAIIVGAGLTIVATLAVGQIFVSGVAGIYYCVNVVYIFFAIAAGLLFFYPLVWNNANIWCALIIVVILKCVFLKLASVSDEYSSTDCSDV